MDLATIIADAIASKHLDHPVYNDSRALGSVLVAAKALDFGGAYDALITLARTGAHGTAALRVALARNPNTPREVAEELDSTPDRRHLLANPAYLLYACEDAEMLRVAKRDEDLFAGFGFATR